MWIEDAEWENLHICGVGAGSGACSIILNENLVAVLIVDAQIRELGI